MLEDNGSGEKIKQAVGDATLDRRLHTLCKGNERDARGHLRRACGRLGWEGGKTESSGPELKMLV